MRILADFMLMAGAIGAAAYCFILAQRLRKLTDLEGGFGGAIAALSLQVTELSRKIDEAKAASQSSGKGLDQLSARADAAARRLELLMASIDDVAPAERPAAKGALRRSPSANREQPSSSFVAARDFRRETVG